MRLIDADKLVDALYDNEFATLCPLDEVSGVIDEAPTVDAVPVVRCRDCANRGRGDCPMEQDYPWISSDSDGFCHRGEEEGTSEIQSA